MRIELVTRLVRLRCAARRAVSLLLLAHGVTGAALLRAQAEQAPPPATTAKAPCKPDSGREPCKPEPEPVREVGGRLLISGGTVVVTANLDLPPHDSSIATKTDTPLIETPRSVSITSRDALDDRLATNITSAHDYTTGFIPADDRGPAFARGFSVGFYDVRRDGLRTYAWSIREPVAVERAQYLRGAAAILYGDGSPGGLVNLVLKKPLPVRRTEVTASGGELDFGRVTADTTGPVNARWRYRLVGAAEWLGNGIQNNERRLSFLPMVSVDLNDAVTLHMDGELYHQRGRDYRHVVPVTPDTQHGDFSRIPWELSIAAPDEGWSGWNVSPGVRLDARLGSRSSAHVSARYTRIGGDLDLSGLVGVAADGRTLQRFAYREISTWQEYQSDAFVTTTASTGRVEHRFVAGIEAGLSTTDSQIGVGAAAPLDMFAPVYIPTSVAPVLRPTRYDILRLGIYAQDQMRLNSAITIVPGLRWSRLGTENRVPATAIAGETPDASSADYAVSPSLGVVVLPRPDLSIYATAARGFEPPTPGQYLADRSPVKPADSQLVEGGVKAELLGRRLAVTSAVFRIQRTNVPEADPLGFYRQIAEGRSWGIEADVVGSVGRGLGIQGGYAWTRTEVLSDAAGFVGKELPNAPRHNASLWIRYRFGAALDGPMASVGVVHVSDRFTASNNTIIVPAYSRFDVSGSYPLRGQRLRLSAAVQNVTNVRYATSGTGATLIVGSPRRAVIELSSAF